MCHSSGVGAERAQHGLTRARRRPLRVELLIIGDFALEQLDNLETNDFCQVVVERHRRASTVFTSSRDPQEWLAMMADPMLAQCAVDRIVNSSYELVLEGASHRSRQCPGRPPA